jgi:hypothetical protein
MSTQQQQGQARVRPDLFLPRHPGDVVRLVTALAVLLVSIKLVNRNHIDELEIDAFQLVNDLPGALYRPLWVVMFSAVWFGGVGSGGMTVRLPGGSVMIRAASGALCEPAQAVAWGRHRFDDRAVN